MINNKTIAVVVSCYNEETQILRVLQTMPDFVDRIVVVNDCSTDTTKAVVCDFIAKDKVNNQGVTITRPPIPQYFDDRYRQADQILDQMYACESKRLVAFEIVNAFPERERIILINNLKNGGKGMSVAVGYSWCREYAIDCIATMDGDGQMDPTELYAICSPIVSGEVDFVKGNRLMHKSARYIIPTIRFIGNNILTILTKIASGYWRVSDTQTGYTAISLAALYQLALDKIYPRYGIHNDILIKLNVANCSIREFPIRPIYRIGERSKMKIPKVIPLISWLLVKSFFSRLWIKYFLRNFHPLFLFYNLSFLLLLIIIPLAISILMDVFIYNLHIQTGTYISFIILSLASFQSLFFAMWMDIQDNERLYK
ncbi:MAG: glycosyltransferase family 2 protein [Oligoflexia bacterium]|nr:glycosyltransferase family 2 protein [Oligoflexia bacterium]